MLGTATGRGRISIFAPSKWTPRANARVLTFIVKRQSTEVLRTFPHRAPNVIVIRIRRRSSVDVGSSSLPRAQAPMHAARPRSICLRVNSRAPVTAQLTKLASQLDDIDWVLGCEDALSAAWSARASVARLPSMHSADLFPPYVRTAMLLARATCLRRCHVVAPSTDTPPLLASFLLVLAIRRDNANGR